MKDYRGKSNASPKVWCPYCDKFIDHDDAAKVMTTVYRVDRSGIYPYGFCTRHYLERSLCEDSDFPRTYVYNWVEFTEIPGWDDQ